MTVRVALCSAVLALYVIGVKTCTEGMDEETLELAKMLRNNCGAETGVDMGLVDKLNAGADMMPDPKLKCYMKCVMETAGMLTDGDVDVETAIEMLPESLRKKHEANIRSCGSIRGANDCETAYNTQECWQKKNKADYCLI